jgi:hypothetical protein
MQFTTVKINDLSISKLVTEGQIINSVQDALDLISEAGSDRVIISKDNLHPDFFDLSTCLAGDILQKFSNYRMYLAIIGDFAEITSKSLRDFIYESNKNRHILYLESEEKIEEFWK